MKKLIEQLVKFGIVGALCFVIDFAITMLVSAICLKLNISTEVSAAIGGLFGFTISVIVNYVLSMKFVFERREDMNRRKEFIIFVILSVIGLGINEVLIVACTKASAVLLTGLYNSKPKLIIAGGKIIATGVVMIYNFVTRKIFLEKKDNDN